MTPTERNAKHVHICGVISALNAAGANIQVSQATIAKAVDNLPFVQGQDQDKTDFVLKIKGDVLSLRVTHPDTPAVRGRVCNVEMALMKHYHWHHSEPVVPALDGSGRIVQLFWRSGSDHALYTSVRDVLKGFGIDASVEKEVG